MEHHNELSDLRRRAASFLSVVPRPFLRWAGSKRAILAQILPHLPQTRGTYYEPFLGGGSLFFLLQPSTAVLADTCSDLIEAYRALKDNPTAVLRYLRPLRPSRDQYYHVRDHRSNGRFKRAAELIYLNKTCWNGLYRVNSAGQFNTPYGRPKSDNIADNSNLRACAGALAKPGVKLLTADFEAAVEDATEEDLVFLDPPYVTGHRDNGFVDYNEVLFSWEDQERLARLARQLRQRGATVVVTNADHEALAALYEGFKFVRLSRSSTIASDPRKRRATSELLIIGAAS